MKRKTTIALVVAAAGLTVLGFAEDQKDLIIGAMALIIAAMWAE